MEKKRLNSATLIRFAAISASIFLAVSATAQTQNLGGPKTWRAKLSQQKSSVKTLPAIDVAALEAEDAIDQRNKTAPWRFGFEHHVNDDVRATGHRIDLDEGLLWRTTYRAPEALTLGVFYRTFDLADGAYVHVFAADGSSYDGAYTAANNQQDRMLATLPVATDEIVVEFFEPHEVSGESQLVIGHVIQGYRDIGDFVKSKIDQAKSLNDSGNCNYDTKCAELPGNPFGEAGEWNDPIRSVVMMMLNGSAICSAALVNNTANDGTPYVLSANHCGTYNGGGRVFVFGYESPTAVCASSQPSTNGTTTKQINGATLRANHSRSDFALWELSTTPPASYNAYYAGWDRSGIAPTNATAIHHPKGDVKKISRESHSPYTGSVGSTQVWWINKWEYGTTESGSSGSPIFDHNKRIIGQLYGGTAGCSGTNPNNGYDYYGRFDVSWTGGTSSAVRLKEWLDPLNTNALVLDGYDPNAPVHELDLRVMAINGLEANYCASGVVQPTVVLKNEGSTSITTFELSATLNGAPAGNATISEVLEPGDTAELTLPELNALVSGDYEYVVTVSNPNGQPDENPQNNSATQDFSVTEDGTQAVLSLQFDCWPTETSWDLRNSSGSILYSGNSYSMDLGTQTIQETFCLDDGCYTFNIYDSYGDGMNGSNYSSCTVDGHYQIVDADSNPLVQMIAPNANFGTQASHTFCIGEEAPCVQPYPVPVNLGHEILTNGVELSWDPVIGSIGCQIQGGVAPAGGLQTITKMGADLESAFVSKNKFSAGKTYRWRVRCGCATNVIGNWSAWGEFTWPGGAAPLSATPTDEEGLTIYPNPTEGALNVVLDGAEGRHSIAVFDFTGKMTNLVTEFDGNSTVLDLTSLPSGVYILEVTGTDGVAREKFVKR